MAEEKQNLAQRLAEAEKNKEEGGTEFSNVATAIAAVFGKQKKLKEGEIVSTEQNSGFELGTSDFLEWEKSLGSSDKKLLKELPTLRMQKYSVYERMAQDPVIFAALKLHANTALSYDEDAGEIVNVKYVGDENDAQSQTIVEELKQLMERFSITDNLFSWGLDTLKLGIWPIRVWGERGKGVVNIESSGLTHPSTMKIYERAGKLAGYTSRFQIANNDEYELLPPWSYVLFRMQGHSTQANNVQHDMQAYQMDLGSAKPPDILTESWNYGRSILEGSFLPWIDLQESIISLNISRRNKAKRDRMIAYPIGGQAPARAAALTQAIAQRLKQRKLLDEEKRLKGGYIPTQDDFLLPYDTNSNGKIEFNTIEPSVDVTAIEDVMFHLKRVCGALGLDPSLIGHGEMLAGGLGEGGWFRSSVLAASTGEQLRRAIASGLNRLFEIHLAYKYKLVYPASERPWNLQFHAASTAKEIELNTNRMLRMDFVDRLGQLIGAFREQGVGVDITNYAKYAVHTLLQMDENEFEDIWDAKAPPPAGMEGEEGGAGGFGPTMPSAPNQPAAKQEQASGSPPPPVDDEEDDEEDDDDDE